MENNLKIIETKPDWKTIFEIIWDRNNWGKKYSIMTYGNTTIYASLNNIYFESEQYVVKIEIDYPKDEHSDYYSEYDYVYHYKRNQTIEEFERHLNIKIKSMLDSIIRARNRSIAQKLYKDKEVTEIIPEVIAKLGMCNDFLLLDNIEDKDIKEDLIHKLNTIAFHRANKRFKELIEEYIFDNDSDMHTIQYIYNYICNILGEEE